jgi:hypothetical protein
MPSSERVKGKNKIKSPPSILNRTPFLIGFIIERRYLKHLHASPYTLQNMSFHGISKISLPPPIVVNKLKANSPISIYGGF